VKGSNELLRPPRAPLHSGKQKGAEMLCSRRFHQQIEGRVETQVNAQRLRLFRREVSESESRALRASDTFYSVKRNYSVRA